MTNNLDTLADHLGHRTKDEIFDGDPLLNTPQDINFLIAHYRANRANHEAGVKPKKEQGPKQQIDLKALGLAKQEEPIRRRI